MYCFFLPAPGAARNVIYRQYTTRDGLPGNKIYSIQQDKQGYTWIGTDKGVVRFNGKTFRTFTIQDGLPSNDVFYFFIDPENRVWLYDYTPYLTYIRNDTVHSRQVFHESTPFSKRQFYYHKGLVITSRSNTHLVIAGSESILVADMARIARDLYPDYQPAHDNMDYISFNGKHFLIYDKRGINYVNLSTGQRTFYKYHPALDSFPFRFARRTPIYLQNYFVGLHPKKQFHLTSLDVQTGKFRTIDIRKYAPGLSSIRTLDVQSNSIQLSTNNRLLVFDTQLRLTDSFVVSTDLYSRTLNVFYKDYSENYWMSTFNDGFFVVPREVKGFEKLSLALNGRNPKFTSAYRSDDGYFLFDELDNLFITDTGFLLRQTRRLLSPTEFEPDPQKIRVFKDSNRGHYIVSGRGIYYLDREYGLYSIYDYGNSIPQGFLTHGLQSFKNAYVEPETGKLIFLNHHSVCRIGFDGRFHYEHVLEKRFLNISRDTRGRYWMSDDLGNLSILDKNLRILHTYNIRYPITGLFTDTLANVIFSVDGKGIFVFNQNAPGIYQLYSGSDIQTVTVDGSGVWFATNNTIRHFVLENGRYEPERTYLNLDGLLYQSTYNIYPEGNHLLLLCDKGILRSALDSIHRTPPAIRIFVSAVTLGGQQFVMGRETDSFIHFYVSGNINFEFSGNSVPYLGNVDYHYFLEGNDEAWQQSSEEKVSYPVLAPGTYTMWVQSRVRNTPVRSAAEQFTIVIKPLWWQTLWFKLLLSLLILSFTAWIVYLRMQAIRRSEHKNTMLQKKIGELELSALQAQMNPHFIFNALSSIQSYIRTHDTQPAEELLKKFSMLIRLYLEFSRHKRITLTQELKALNLYTEIERLRFGYRFDVLIRIRSARPADSVLIPPMMIQPIVENAINHGLYHKKGKGLLKVIFCTRKDQLVVFIDDNGIGRTAARKLRSKLFPSRGNTLIQERIEILRATGLADTSIQIQDKLNDDNAPAGTRVILKMNIPEHD